MEMKIKNTPVDLGFMNYLTDSLNSGTRLVMFCGESGIKPSLIAELNFEVPSSGNLPSLRFVTESGLWGYVERHCRELFKVYELAEPYKLITDNPIPMAGTRKANRETLAIKPATWRDLGGCLVLSLRVPTRLIMMNFGLANEQFYFAIQPHQEPVPYTYLFAGNTYKVDRPDLLTALCHAPCLCDEVAATWKKKDFVGWMNELQELGIIGLCLIDPFPIEPLRINQSINADKIINLLGGEAALGLIITAETALIKEEYSLAFFFDGAENCNYVLITHFLIDGGFDGYVMSFWRGHPKDSEQWKTFVWQYDDVEPNALKALFEAFTNIRISPSEDPNG